MCFNFLLFLCTLFQNTSSKTCTNIAISLFSLMLLFIIVFFFFTIIFSILCCFLPKCAFAKESNEKKEFEGVRSTNEKVSLLLEIRAPIERVCWTCESKKSTQQNNVKLIEYLRVFVLYHFKMGFLSHTQHHFRKCNRLHLFHRLHYS